jgi:hypothetical protein
VVLAPQGLPTIGCKAAVGAVITTHSVFFGSIETVVDRLIRRKVPCRLMLSRARRLCWLRKPYLGFVRIKVPKLDRAALVDTLAAFVEPGIHGY